MTTARQSGMSLVEVLVVLAIVGVLASMVTLSIGAATRGESAEAEARRLATHIRLAMDEALVTDMALTLAWDDTGYAFQVPGDGPDGFVPYAVPALGNRHDLPAALRLESDGTRQALRIQPDGDGQATVLTIRDGDQAWRISIDGFAANVAPEAS